MVELPCFEVYFEENKCHNTHSQFGDEILYQYLLLILKGVPTTCVEFGVANGVKHSNTHYLRMELGWWSCLFDVTPSNGVIQAFITVENVTSLFAEHSIPQNLGILSVDIDGNDHHVLNRILLDGWRPRIVTAESNIGFKPDESYVFPYDPEYKWDGKGTGCFGASPLAFARMFKKYGYHVVVVRGMNVTAVSEEDFDSLKHLVRGCLYKPRVKHGGPDRSKFLPYD